MKAVFIAYNKALSDAVITVLDRQHIRGYTNWDTVGRGTEWGEPHMGSHAWPAVNSTIITIVEDSKVAPLLHALKLLDKEREMQGLKAYVWNVEEHI